jgi:hypothetical protein
METEVRRHLRGKEDFKWGEWVGRIQVSTYDWGVADVARELREVHRFLGTDRRPRTWDGDRNAERCRVRFERLEAKHREYREELAKIENREDDLSEEVSDNYLLDTMSHL